MKNITEKLVIILVLILGLAFTTSLSMLRTVNSDYKTLEKLLDNSINQYETTIIDKDQKINTQAQVVTNLENAVTTGRVTIEELKARDLKKDVTIIRMTKEIERLNLVANYVQPADTEIVYVTSETPVEGWLKVPQKFEFHDKWDDIWGTVQLENVLIDKKVTRIEPTYYLGYQSRGYFRKPASVVISEDLNPFVTVTGMQNTIIQSKPPFHKRPNWYRAEGAAIVVLVTETLKFIMK